MRNRLLQAFAAVLLLLLLLLTAHHADAAAAVISDRLRLCAETLIPSLFGCTVLADLLRESGAGQWLGARLRLFGRALRLSPGLNGIFLVSQLAGYPVGALLLRQECERGRLSESDAAAFSCAAFGGGPAFLVGLCGVQLFGSAAAGWTLWLSCFAANCAAARLLSPRNTPVHPPEPVHLSAPMIPQAVSGAVASLMQICGTVVLFGLAAWLCELLEIVGVLVKIGVFAGISAQTVHAVFAAVLDVTQLTALLHCGLQFQVLLPLTAALLSFGGLCVQTQCLALGVRGMRPGQLLCYRLLTALLAALLTALAVPFLPMPAVVPAMAQGAAVSQTGSVLPGILIMLTGFPVVLHVRERPRAARFN